MRSFKTIFLSFLFFLSVCILHAQTPTYSYSFFGCGFAETNGLLSDALVGGNPSCVCGPRDTAMSFDGLTDNLELPLPGNLLKQDYTFTFFMKPGLGSFAEQMFTNERSCNTIDSLFSIQFFPSISTVSVRLSDKGATQALVDGELDSERCWHHIAVVKQGRILQLYINGVKKGQYEGNLPVNIESTTPIRVAYTTCSIAQNLVPFKGEIDEIAWYNKALTSSQIAQIGVPLDRSLTGDTLIFKGDIFVPIMSRTCASSVNWSPPNGLSSTTILAPTIDIPTTQKYRITYDYTGCTAFDSMTVTVIDPDLIICKDMFLPSAFTPNGDGINDQYGISNDFILESLESFQIMDRNGNSIFESEVPGEMWDGYYRGKKMGVGTYVYRIAYTCKGESFSKTGSFSIIR